MDIKKYEAEWIGRMTSVSPNEEFVKFSDVEALMNYVEHEAGCASMIDPNSDRYGPCNCGLDEALGQTKRTD